MINFLNMKYFLVVAEAGSFSAAAKQLYIAQQTLSEHVAQIEKELGTKLFERTRPLTLTPSGERFYRRAREMLFLNLQLEREIQDLADPLKNSFRVGISHAYARSILPAMLNEFYQIYPEMNLQIFEMSYQEMDDALTTGKVDLIFTRPIHLGAHMKVVPLYEDDDVYLYAPRITLERKYGEKLPEILERLQEGEGLAAVGDCPFILPRSGNVCQNANHLFMEAQIAPPVRIKVDTLETAILLCRKGLGVTVSPEMLLPICTGLDMSALSDEVYLLSRSQKEFALAICYRENGYVTNAMRAFIDVVRKMGLNSYSEEN